MELISVVIPVYNSEQYLGQCLDSVCGQTYPNLEIVLVDDGSTDGSYDICMAYANADGRIKAVRKGNGGEASARKAGIQASSGTVIAFVDSDDWLDADAIERMYSEMDMQKADIVAAGYIEARGESEKTVQNKLGAGVYRGKQLKEDFYPAMLCSADYFELGLWPFFWNKLFRREVIEPCVLALDDRLVVGVDVIGTFPSFLRAGTVSILPDAFYHYRIHAGSVMHKFRREEKEVENIRLQYHMLKDIFEKSEYWDVLKPQMERYIFHHFIVRAIGFLEKELRLKGTYLVERMRAGSKIILYGAGAFGASFYYHNQTSKEFLITGWCDQNYKEIQKMGYPVIALDEALKKPFDYVMIAVLNQKVKEQIQEDFVLKGIPKEKIKWICKTGLNAAHLEQICG